MENRLMYHRGFSLVELSVVIIIIGVIVAGVLSGKSLIDSSKMRSDIKKLSEYKLSAESFKEKFLYYPGDFPKASVYWAGYPHNGDGNYYIDNSEFEPAWQHLFKAGLHPVFIEMGMDGEKDISESPKASEKDAFFSFYGTKDTSHFYEIGNYLNISSSHTDGGLYFAGGYAPARALAFDNKIDDGIYNKGKVFILDENFGNYAGDCITAGQLNLADSLKNCWG